MPTYTYRCEACGHRTEGFHAARKRLSLECDKCGKSPMTWQFPCPNLQTEKTFLANRDDGFANDNHSRQAAKAKARAAGVNTAGMVYCPSLCPLGERLSPKAWVSGKAEAKRICRQNNWYSEDLGVRPAKIDAEPEPYRVADDLVAEEVDSIVESQGGDVSPKERVELSHQVRERVTPVGRTA